MKQLQFRHGRIILLAAVLLLVVGLLFRHQVLSILPLDKTLGYAALVNGEPIYLSEIEKAGALKHDALEELIVQKLILQEAEKSGIAVTDDDINNVLEKMNLSTKDALEFIGSSSLGEMKMQLLIAKYLNYSVLADITITPEEEKVYYKNHSDEFMLPESVHVAHILVKDTEKTGLQLDETLQRIIDDIKKGVSFEKLARLYSEDSASAALGGDLGFVYRGQTIPEFEKVVFGIPVNGTSTTFKTRYGFHVAKVYDKLPSRLLEYDEVNGRLQQMLLAQKQKQAFLEHLDVLKSKAEIIKYINE